jgi:hypothetical protein
MARVEKPRGLRDEANVGPDPRRARELRPLKDMKWKVADGEPDIRGWPVFASTGRVLGVVDELIVDAEAREVVMLDIDLKRDDRHTLAPVRAAWIDRPAKRVVVDARELGADETLPVLPRAGEMTDDDVNRFNDGYVRAYGDRGYEADRTYRLRRGDEELRFGPAPLVDRRAQLADTTEHRTPQRLIDPNTPVAPVTPVRPATPVAGSTDAAYFDESRMINRELADLPRDRAAAKDDLRARAERVIESLPDAEGIEPRELDARVRIDEGATVDESTPVAGVRYPDENHPRHSYGRVEDVVDERYDDRVVSRHRHVDDVADPDAADAERRLAETSDGRVRYRNYAEDAGRPDDLRP